MLDNSLATAMDKIVDITNNLSEADLERAWAWGAYDSEGVRFTFFRTYEELRQLAVTIATERAAQGPPPTKAQRILAQYHAAYRDLQAALLGVEPGDEEQEPAEGEWPLRQIVSHIVEADTGFYGIVRYALDRHRSGDGRPAEIPREAWDDLVGLDDMTATSIFEGSLAGLRAYYQELHERVLTEFAGIRDEELALPSMYWEGYELNLQYRLHRFDSHLRQHTIQVDKTLVEIGRAPGEVKRLLRLLYAALAQAEGETIGAWDLGADARSEVAASITARYDEIALLLTGSSS